jgi:hypothetical protein
MNPRTQRIRALNDQLRQNLATGVAVMTPGVAALGEEATARIIKTIAVFDDFCHANDPHEEHDFGSFEAEGHTIFFKVDYFDRTLNYHSPDPTDPAAHRPRDHRHARGRILTALTIPRSLGRQPSRRRRTSRLRSASAVAGKVWSVAAGVLMQGPLRSHRCSPGDLGTTTTQPPVQAGAPVELLIPSINDRTNPDLSKLQHRDQAHGVVGGTADRRHPQAVRVPARPERGRGRHPRRRC